MKHADTVPATLDVADHGRMAIHGILGSLNPVLDYECVFLFDAQPPTMLHWSSMVGGGHTAVKLTRVPLPGDPLDRDWYRVFRRDSMMATDVPERANPAYVHSERMPL